MFEGVTYHTSIEALGHCPGGDDVIHDPFGEGARYFVEFHELADVVEHFVILGRGRRHLLDDGGHVTENGRVQQSCKTSKFLRMINQWDLTFIGHSNFFFIQGTLLVNQIKMK